MSYLTENRRVLVFTEGLIDKIKHCISQNLIFDNDFKVKPYIQLCKEVLKEKELPEELVQFICTVASKKGRSEFRMRKKYGIMQVSDHGGSMVHPEFVIGYDAVQLKKIVDSELVAV